MKKKLLIGFFACFLFSFAEAQDFSIFISKFKEIPVSGVLVNALPFPQPLDTSLNRFVGAGAQMQISPIGKIQASKKLVYVFYFKSELIDQGTRHRLTTFLQAFSISGTAEGDKVLFHRIEAQSLEACYPLIEKLEILPTKNRMIFKLMRESGLRTQMRFLPKKKDYRTKVLG